MKHTVIRKTIAIFFAGILVLSTFTVAYADDLRKTNSGTNCIKYGTRTWKPVSYSKSWYKYNINKNTVSARGGTHRLSDAQAKKYGLKKASSGGSSSGTYNPKIIDISKVNIVRGAKVKSATAYKKSSTIKIIVNNDKSGFTQKDIAEAKKINNSKGWIALSPVDSDKRANRAVSLINDNSLPTANRKPLTYNPPGWNNKQVMIQGKKIWFYNRSHLVAYCLSGLNDEKRNLITGAVKFNTPTMSDIEVKVLNYVRNTDNAVLYEVTPVYNDSELVARGVQIRYLSIDLGKPDNNKIEGNVYIYNMNPGWVINYASGAFNEAA